MALSRGHPVLQNSSARFVGKINAIERGKVSILDRKCLPFLLKGRDYKGRDRKGSYSLKPYRKNIGKEFAIN